MTFGNLTGLLTAVVMPLLALISALSLYYLLEPSDYHTVLGFAPTNETVSNNENVAPTANFTLDTDKKVYVAGESVELDGKVDQVIEAENIRLDLYDPDGKPLSLFIKFTQPNKDGYFSFSGVSAPAIPDNAKPGEYTFLATYNKQSVETKATVGSKQVSGLPNLSENVSDVTTGGDSSISSDKVTMVPGSSGPSNGRFYEPPIISINLDTTVTWKNADSMLHTVTSGTPDGGDTGALFDSSYLAAGKTFQWTFKETGKFDYYCTLHPFMKGQVLVE